MKIARIFSYRNCSPLNVLFSDVLILLGVFPLGWLNKGGWGNELFCSFMRQSLANGRTYVQWLSGSYICAFDWHKIDDLG